MKGKRLETQGIRAILFDFDGTLAILNIDFGEMRKAVKVVGAEFGVPDTFLDNKYILEAIDDAISAMNGDGDGPNEFYRAAHQAIIDIELTAARKSGLIPGTVELFEWLKSRHIRTGIVTRNCRQAVDLIGGKALLPDAILTRNEVTRVKPDPLHLTQALDELAVTPEASLLVGDHPMDMVAGRAAGMRSVGVLTGDSTEQRLIEGGAVYVIPSVANLIELVTQENLLGF